MKTIKLIVTFALLLVCSVAIAQSGFVRGDKVIFEDNLVNETVGKSPTKWTTGGGGKAEITQANGEKVIWFPVSGTTIEATLKTSNNYLPENFTIECDFTGSQDEHGEWSFSLNHPDGGEYQRMGIKFRNNRFNLLWAGKEGIKSSSGAVDLLRTGWNRLALSYNNGDLQIFVNGKRIVNLSGVQPSQTFTLSAFYHKEAPKNLLLRNIRICSIKSTMPTNTKSTFVSGSVIIFEDNFANEKAEAAPSKWNMQMGKAKIARLNNENVLSFPESDIITPAMNSKNYLPDNYTIELEFYAPKDKIGKLVFSLKEANKDNDVTGIGWSNIVGSMSSKTTPISIGWKTNFGEVLNNSNVFADLSKEGWHRLAVSCNQGVLNVYIDGVNVHQVGNVAKAGWFSAGVLPMEKTGFYLRNVLIAK